MRVFFRVGYVFLVSSALEPLSCFQDRDQKWYMSAHPQLECNWCKLPPNWLHPNTDPTAPGYDSTATDVFILFSQTDLPYPVLAIASYFIASIYAIGVPILFFTIMYNANRNNEMRKKKWTNHYGFLTSKTSEKYYW